MTLNPQPLVLHLNTKRDALVESYRRETELYAAGFVNRAPDCPNGPPRKVVVFSRDDTATTEIYTFPYTTLFRSPLPLWS